PALSLPFTPCLAALLWRNRELGLDTFRPRPVAWFIREAAFRAPTVERFVDLSAFISMPWDIHQGAENPSGENTHFYL
ncbi:MAG TPA: hypothetical protein VMO17_00710, partial [Terriglobia bacterium]|nr:hypothetical protein [Terriglobia bacterium]